MKKIFGIFLSLFTFLLFVPGPAFAASLCPPGNFANLCNLRADNAGSAVGNFITILIIIAIILALIYLVYGGIKWITSGGDKGKIEAARSHIIAAIVGLIIAFLAFFIVGILLGFFGLNVRELQLPTLF